MEAKKYNTKSTKSLLFQHLLPQEDRRWTNCVLISSPFLSIRASTSYLRSNYQKSQTNWKTVQNNP